MGTERQEGKGHLTVSAVVTQLTWGEEGGVLPRRGQPFCLKIALNLLKKLSDSRCKATSGTLVISRGCSVSDTVVVLGVSFFKDILESRNENNSIAGWSLNQSTAASLKTQNISRHELLNCTRITT